MNCVTFKLTMSTIVFLLLNLISFCHGQGVQDSTILLKFLEDFNFLHLDSIKYDFIEIEFKGDSEEPDETLATFIDEIEKISKLIGFQTQENCTSPMLKIISITSLGNLSSTNCNNKGQFIKDVCQNFLIFAFKELLLDDLFISKIRCYYPFQPFIHIIKKNQALNLDLYEMQIFSNKYIHLAYFDIKENVIW